MGHRGARCGAGIRRSRETFMRGSTSVCASQNSIMALPVLGDRGLAVLPVADEAAFDWRAAAKDLMDELDTTVPHSARIWSYWQGGKDYYRIDQQAGDRVAAVFPGIAHEVRCSRYFLARALRYLAIEAGIRQFLDIGAGLPTVDNTHEIAQRVDAQCRIVYADNDPLVVAHGRALLTSGRGAATGHVLADLRDTETILAEARDTLDLTQPVAVIFNAVLGHIPGDRDACSAVTRLMD